MSPERRRTPWSHEWSLPLLPSLGVLFAGAAALAAWFLIHPLLGPDAARGYYRPALAPLTLGYSRAILLLFVPFGLALYAWRRGARTSLALLVGGAVILHLALLLAPPPQSQDVYQYLFYGRLQAAYHYNPYVVVATHQWLDPWYSWIRWPTQVSVYGPVWTLISYGVAKAAGSDHALAYIFMKLVVLAMDLAVMALIVAVARDRGDEDAAGWGILAYAWNPLILVSVPLGGLIDVSVAAGLVGAYLARRRGHQWVATVLFALTALVKVYAGIGLILHLVLLARERGLRRTSGHAAASVGLAAATFAPYWAGFDTFRGLLHIASLSNNSLFGTLQSLLTPVIRTAGVAGDPVRAAGAIVRWAGMGLLLASVVWAIRRVKTEADLWHGVLIVLCVYSLITPWFFYWYLVAPIALVALRPRDRLSTPLLTGSGTLFVTIAFHPWLLAKSVEMAARYGPPLALYGRERRRNRRAHAAASGPASGPGSTIAVRPPPVPATRDAAAAK